METKHFKNSLTFNKHLTSMSKKGYYIEYSTIQCNCGDSEGAYVVNVENRESIEKCILCSHCYRRNGGK